MSEGYKQSNDKIRSNGIVVEDFPTTLLIVNFGPFSF